MQNLSALIHEVKMSQIIHLKNLFPNLFPIVCRGFRMLIVSLCGGMVTAYGIIICVMDGRFHFSALLNLSSYGAAAIFGGIGGLVMFPLTYYCLRDRQLFPAVLWLCLFSAFGSLLAAMLSLPPGILWSFIVATIGLLACRWWAKPLSLQKDS
jgi:hypothetical protein